MKNNYLKIAFIVCLGALVALSSCKEEPVEPEKMVDEPLPPKDTITPVTEVRNIDLYVANNTNPTGEQFKFYNIETNTLSNDVTSTIHMSFFYDDRNDSKHHFGSSASLGARREFGIPDTNQTSMIFFTVANNFSTAVFDTLRDVRTIGRYFDSQDLDLVKANSNRNQADSDQFGWDEDEILAFRLFNGKRGLIKLNQDPDVFISNDGRVNDGLISFDIKWEGP